MIVLKTFPNDYFDTIITSPPYWGLRDYGIKGQIGLEKTLEEYINKLLAITRELKRVLKPTGVMFWNHGDCYGGSGQGSQTGYGDKKRQRVIGTMEKAMTLSLPAKCLAGQNYRLLFRMIDEQQWIWRNQIIWAKPNHMPSSVKDRFANSYEPVFMLVKNKKYWFDLDAVRVPHQYPEDVARRIKQDKENGIMPFAKDNKSGIAWRRDLKKKRNVDPRGNDKGGPGSWRVFKEDNPNLTHPLGKNPGDLWTIPTQPFPEAHFATFPERLIEPMIKSNCPQWVCKKCGKARVRITKTDYQHHSSYNGHYKKGFKGRQASGFKDVSFANRQTLGWTKCPCNSEFEGGIVLDPFMGAGTTGVMARKLERNFVGIELNKKYIDDIAIPRLEKEKCLWH